MGTLLWLSFTTTIGGVIGQFVLGTPHPVIGALIGFVVGLVALVSMTDAVEVLGDVDFGD